jgi:hypothetical protein
MLAPLIRFLANRPNKALQPTAGRRTERLKDEFMKDEAKATLAAASGG